MPGAGALCRACLVQRRSLRSVFARVRQRTYADLLAAAAGVKIRPNDGYSEFICKTCRRKAEEAFDFKTLVEESDNTLRGINPQTNTRKFIFDNVTEIKVEIEGCKLENVQENSFEDKNDVKFDFKQGEDEMFYNNTVIKKLIKSENKEITVEDFLNNINIKAEVGELNNDIDEDAYFDDWIENSKDDEYLPSNTKKFKQLKNLHKAKKKKSKDEDILKKQVKVKIRPVYLEDVRLMSATPKFTKPKSKNATKKYVHKQSICPYCGLLTKSIKTHLLVHTGERKFKCSQCPKAYFTKKGLENHEVIHSGERNFKCDICGSAFFQKLSLHSHIKSHGERNHVCEICSKKFKRKCTLTRHILRHSSANKCIKCELCNMSFFEKHQLDHHMRVHTGERPFNCELCSQPYSYKHDFNRHCFKKHGIFLKRRRVYVMNAEVLQRERASMEAAMLEQQTEQAVQSIFPHAYKIPSEAFGMATTQAAIAYKQTVEALQLKSYLN